MDGKEERRVCIANDITALKCGSKASPRLAKSGIKYGVGFLMGSTTTPDKPIFNIGLSEKQLQTQMHELKGARLSPEEKQSIMMLYALVHR